MAKDAEALGIFIYSKITPEVLDKLPNLKHITTCSTGFDHIYLEACKEKGITVSNVPTYGENTVAEHTFALILNLTRKVHQAYDNMIHGKFGLGGLRGIDLKGRTQGLRRETEGPEKRGNVFWKGSLIAKRVGVYEVESGTISDQIILEPPMRIELYTCFILA